MIEKYFGEFKTLGDPVLEEMLEAALKFCIDMASVDCPAYWLSFLGVSGVGKTMLTKGIVKFFNRNLSMELDENYNPKTHRVLRKGGMKNWPNAMNDMVSGDYSGLTQLHTDWLVALDDIAAEYKGNRELSISKLYEVLNRREGKWTIITCNLSLDQVSKELDRRLASRLTRNAAGVIDCTTKDYNLRQP